MDSILSNTAPGFMFFLLRVCVGYIAVGDIQKVKRTWSLERSIYYVLSWIWINFLFLLMFSKLKYLSALIDVFIIKNQNQTINANDMINISLFALGYFVLLILFVRIIKRFFKRLKRYF